MAAQHWIASPPYPGYDHWATRFPLVITLAATLRLLGENETALTVVALLWYVVFLLAVFALAQRIGGRRVGWIATILLSTMPVVVTNATTASCDLVEATFLVLGIVLAGDAATRDTRPGRRAVAAGLAFGVAILCRETTTLALMGFVPLFMLGRPISRRALCLMAVACFALLAGEAVFQWAMTGNPLNRWDVAFHHDAHIDRAANAEGNFLLHPVIDPLLVLLVNNDFGLIFWIFLIAAWLRVDRLLDVVARRRTIILAALALATFILTGVLYTKLVLNPRYFMLPAIAAAIMVSVWLGSVTVRTRTVVLAVAVAVNFLMLSVENTHPRWAAEALVSAARAQPDTPIVTDAQTYHRALMPLQWHHLSRIERGPSKPGQLLLLPNEQGPVGATVVARYPSPSTPLGAILKAVRLDEFIPPSIRRRLVSPNPTAVLVRT
ncbi:glycosyltransferase family 39 protein [Sphingomonas sp. OK281]|uniref:ArnT family glycosyltransferase n=1 Tax=Sphingomonas sp. OK281 TaxID=1881067 RepID=UPI001587E010|nr:glycosyltransferase family 39 protein [Sphingomonas sp. OK281]